MRHLRFPLYRSLGLRGLHGVHGRFLLRCSLLSPTSRRDSRRCPTFSIILTTFALCVSTLSVPANAEPAKSVTELLSQVLAGSKREEEINREREQKFRQARDEQASLLASALAERDSARAKSEELERVFEANEQVLPELEETLRLRLGTLGELFGVVRQVAGETQSQVETSIISAELPGREAVLQRLATSRELPSIEELRGLWHVLQQEMTAQGQVVRFPAKVLTTNGEEVEREVTRVGPFNAFSDGRYLQ